MQKIRLLNNWGLLGIFDGYCIQVEGAQAVGGT